MTSRPQVKDETLITVISLREAVAEYGEFMKGTRLSKASRTGYMAALERLVTMVPKSFMAHQLKPFQINEAIREAQKPESDKAWALRRTMNTSATRRTGRSDASLDVDNTAFRGFVKYLKGMSYLSAHVDPCYALVNSPGEVNAARRELNAYHLPMDKRDDLLDEAGKIHPLFRIMVAMMMIGGRRYSDLVTMKVGDLDLWSEIKTFTFRNKKAKNKPVKLPLIFDELVAELRMWLGELCERYDVAEPDPDWYLFPRTLHTKEFIHTPGRNMVPEWPVDVTTPVSYQTALKHIRTALRAVGAPVDAQDLGPHCLRHACGDWLVQEMGWTEEHVSYYLDHKDVRTTAIYTKGVNRAKLLHGLYADGPVPEGRRENPRKPSVVKERTTRLRAFKAEAESHLSLVA